MISFYFFRDSFTITSDSAAATNTSLSWDFSPLAALVPVLSLSTFNNADLTKDCFYYLNIVKGSTSYYLAVHKGKRGILLHMINF